MESVFGCTTDPQDYSNGSNMLTESDGDRPLVVGSYTRYAYVIDDNVYEMFPVFSRDYKLHDITKEAGVPDPNLLKTVLEETTRFLMHTSDREELAESKIQGVEHSSPTN
jgi:membrane-anchored protein YejM (alkaline phosphatase superfamily)